MLRFNSLKTRILVLTTVPLSVLLVVFLILTLRTARDAVDASVRHSLRDAGSVFVKLLATRRSELTSMARVTARDPRFFATFSIPKSDRGPEFIPTLEGVASDFLHITDADFLEILDTEGRLLAYVGPARDDSLRFGVQAPAAVKIAVQNAAPVTDFYRAQGQLVVAAIVPVFVTSELEAVLRLGSFCDGDFAREVRRLTGAEVCVTDHGEELASTFAHSASENRKPRWLPRDDVVTIAPDAFALSDAFSVQHDGKEHLAVQVRIESADQSRFDVYLSRELGNELAPIFRVTRQMAIIGVAGLLITFFAAYLVTRRITGPISAVVRAAEELQSGNYEHPLEPEGADEVAFLGRSFVGMRGALRSHVEHLRSVDQMKSNFIALAGHELKNPLTVISSFNEMIVSGEMGQVPKDVMETTQLIQGKLWDLDRLVENILDMSRAEQGLLDVFCEDHDLGPLVRGVVAKRQHGITRRSLRITADVFDEPLIVAIDARRIERALLNLVDNALRFTPDGGSIRVELRRQNDDAVIAVHDTGVGMTAEEVKLLFARTFDTGDVMNHTSGRFEFGSRGFGLGLALSRAIVDAHGGEMQVHSRPGSGSVFSIVLRTRASNRGRVVQAPLPAPAEVRV